MKQLLLPVALLASLSASAFAEAPTPSTEFRKTLTAAGKDNKMAFILLGRAACGNCNATKAMIRDGKIPVTTEDFVMADLNIDDPKTEGEFMRKYGKEKFGDTLPFVVVTDSHGKALASSSGFKPAAEWAKVITEGKTKAGAKATGAGAATGGTAPGNWPFKTPPKQ